MRLLTLSLVLISTLTLSAVSLADNTLAPYEQKTLSNQDVETTYATPDGTQVDALQHKDGSMETTSVSPDGTKSVIIQRKDGTADVRLTDPNKKLS